MDDRLTSTTNDFESLLSWFSENRELAGEMYEKIRVGLIRYFYFKGCKNGEDLADETINRVTKKLSSLDFSAQNKPATIFYGFAQNVALEELRKDKLKVPIDPNFREKTQDSKEPKFNCLDECLKNLPTADETLLRQYYEKSKSEKAHHRQKLAKDNNLSEVNLHVKLHRLRKTMRNCIEICMRKKNL